MVCIAAFIILCLLSVFVGVVAIFRRDVGKKYWATFKKAWGCVGKRVTFQKCETNFKEDVKNSILKKVVIKKPKLVKPISVGIEIAAVLIVLVTAWSLVEGAKAGLALWTLGTCNVSQPEACVVGAADVCPVGGQLNWFEEWGVIFQAIPDKFRNWDAEQFMMEEPIWYHAFDESKPMALDVFDPGCDKCLQSFMNQLGAGFFESHNVAMLPYPTAGESREFRFNNSYTITTYILAAAKATPVVETDVNWAWRIVQRMFTEFDENGVIWQSTLKADETDETKAGEIIENWLRDWGYTESEVAAVREMTTSQRIKDEITEIGKIVNDDIRVLGVPTTIFDGQRHTGIFRQ